MTRSSANAPMSFLRNKFLSAIAALCTVFLISIPPRVCADELTDAARHWDSEIRNRIMPYWFDTAQDQQRGGYLLADRLAGRGRATSKQLVTQSRMVWTFSLAHHSGFSTAKRNYLEAAEHGYQFLVDHFLDGEHGGYCWKTDLEGEVVNDGKFLYGQSFVVYAFVEYYRASQDRSAVRRAMELYALIQAKLHDARNGGWHEHAGGAWELLSEGDPRNEVELIGRKSANAHLHWMEALTELYEVTKDPAVRKSLEEAVDINRKYFYPLRAEESCFHRTPDWQPVTGGASDGLSYGHNVEFAWLLIRAEEVLGVRPSWRHFRAHIDHALKYGYDHELGGAYNRGFGNEPATDQRKVWWVQAEMVAALTDALRDRQSRRCEKALLQVLGFVQEHQLDRVDGIWLDTVSREGQPVSDAKAHNWKGAYHDVRGLLKFVEAFGRD